MFRVAFVVVLISLGLIGCGDEKEACVFVPESPSAVDLDLQPLQDTLVNITSKDELVRLFTRYPIIR
ncbi:MAG TPA: hypothetical protein VIU13_17405, partial [Chryseolinea sp.]